MSGKEIELRDNAIVPPSEYLMNKIGELKEYKKFRDEIDKFIGENFTKNIDYGPPFPGCDKPTLLQPGAQKVCRLLSLRAVFVADQDTYKMFGSPSALVCFVCFLVPYNSMDRSFDLIKTMGENNVMQVFRGLSVSEGRGAAALEEKMHRDANTVVKKAQKRAQVDAVIRIGDLSDRYTQDMEDYVDEKSYTVSGDNETRVVGNDILDDDDDGLIFSEKKEVEREISIDEDTDGLF